VNFEPKIDELVRTGATAAMLLDGIKYLCEGCIEHALRRIDHAMNNGTMTPDIALLMVSEIAAYRRVIQRQQQTIVQGRSAAQRQLEETRQ
jgi:hypothetical protein